MNNHGYGSDDSDFREFRRRKAKHQRQARDAKDTEEPQRQSAIEVIEERERREALESQLRREMFEFVRDTTKLAAGVLARVGDDQASTMSRQISDEMQDFFKTAMYGTEDLVAVLKAKHGQDVLRLSPAEIEAHMAALNVEDMDRYRAQGNEELAMKHFGQKLQPENRPKVAAPKKSSFTTSEPLPDFGHQDLTETLGAEAQPDALHDLAELGEVISGTTPAALPVPAAFAELLNGADRAKRTLALLVRHGLLDRETARQVYAQRPPSHDTSPEQPQTRQVQRTRRSKGGSK
jgi:hypothetical protein